MFREEPFPRKKSPKAVAVILTEQCTGCEVCIDFCPVDCIDILPGPEHRTLNRVCIINEDVCIGCQLCVKYCPWETISMLKYAPRVEEQEAHKAKLAPPKEEEAVEADAETETEAEPEEVVA